MIRVAPTHVLITILALAVALSAVALVLLVSPDSAIERHPVSLRDIEMLDLEENRILFLSAESDTPAITSDEAIELAQNHYGVREVLLARVSSEGHGIDDRLVWVVNYDPLTIPPIAAHTDYNLYYLAVIDASSGEQLIARGAGDSCGRADLFPEYRDVTEPICSGDIVPGAPQTNRADSLVFVSQSNDHVSPVFLGGVDTD